MAELCSAINPNELLSPLPPGGVGGGDFLPQAIEGWGMPFMRVTPADQTAPLSMSRRKM